MKIVKRLKQSFHPIRNSLCILSLFGLILHGESQKFSRDEVPGIEKQSEWRNPSMTPEPSSCTKNLQWSDKNCLVGPVSVKTDIAASVFHQLCPKARGKKEAPTSCDYYIICHDGRLTVNRCPAGNHFHPMEKKCVDSHLFECSYPVLKDPMSLFREKAVEAVFKRQAYPSQWNPPFPGPVQDWKSGLCREEGIFSHPYSCEYFIQCGSGGRSFEQKCPVGTAFNPLLSVCDWKQNVKCHPRKKRFVANLNQNLVSSPIAQEMHLIDKRSPCEADFISPHPEYCNKFQMCSNGRIHTQECGPGSLFDPLKKICALTETVDCKSRQRDFTTYDCQKGHKYSTTHPDDCHKFVECENERIHVKACPSNTVFNPEKGYCDFARKSPESCRPHISLEHDIDINYLQITRERLGRDLSNYVCEFNYIAPLDGTCNQFIECENKRLFKKTCGPGTAYNRLLGQCDWPYNVKSADLQYCRRYLQCDGRNFVPKECPSNSYYNPQTGRCDSIEKVDCNGKRDDPRGNGYFQSK